MGLVRRENSIKIEAMAADIIVFLLAFFWFIEIKIVGQLFLIELVYLITAVILILSPGGRLSLSPFLKKFFFLLVVWLLALMFSDWYRGSAFVDYARGWSKVFFFGINVLVIYQLCRNNPRRLFIYLLGLALGGLVKPSFFPETHFLEGGIWKFGYGFPVTSLALLAAYFFGVNLGMVAFGLALLNLGLGFRSMALFCFMGTLLSILSEAVYYKKFKNAVLLLRNVFLIIVAISAFFYFYYEIGVFESSTIDMGQFKLEGAAKNPLYGRLEFLGGLKAVWDSPLIGRGSWAKDPKYLTFLEEVAEEVGRGFYQEDSTIPSHSYVLGAWVEAGILGALFWLFVLFQSLRGMKTLVKHNIQPIGLYGFLLSFLIWAILFSAFGAGERLTAAFFTVLVNYILMKPAFQEGVNNP